MRIGYFVILLCLVGASLAYIGSQVVEAAPPQQQFATNTPLPDGRITYKIEAGDTCTKIQLLYGISLEQLRELNQNINADCTNLQEGQEVLVGIGGPAAAASVTAGPAPTAGPPTVTPTPFAGTTEICVLLFDDLNGDTLHQADEPAIAGGAISVTETGGKYSKTQETTVNPDPTAEQGTCFSDVPEGKYNIGAAIPDNYNPTTDLTYTLDLKAGDRARVDFGAQSRGTTGVSPESPDTGSAGTSPLLGFLGGVLLLGGIGLGWFALRSRSPRGRPRGGGLLRR
ncbi:MAG: LysM peptidoglycan-binding domain-containing protein [Anaerolineales bacterium]|jgi:murein DD-endopeptidase MepM/ murein hydrolase activator NlpD